MKSYPCHVNFLCQLRGLFPYHPCLLDNSEPSMLRLTELKLPLTALPLDVRRASDAPSETDEDREPVAHPLAALTALAS